MAFLACPDFKGIKTEVFCPVESFVRFWPALISKGLRRKHHTVLDAKGGFWPALISKGLRQSMITLSEMRLFVSGLP